MYEPIINNQYHHHYETNTIGRDFIVGDLHGVYTILMNALDAIKFDFTVDRLLSCGDLIDRGPESMKCASLLVEQWFIPVQGNHEMLMWKSLLEQDDQYISCWLSNGGNWFAQQPVQQMKYISQQFKNLPLIISVGNNNDRFNIVHAEITRYNNALFIPANNIDIDNWQFNSIDMDNMLWGRNIIGQHTDCKTYKLRQSPVPTPTFQSEELSITYCGHSIIPNEPIKIERQIYIDTGCVGGMDPNYKYFHQTKYPLIIVCPNEQLYYSYDNQTNKLITVPISSIKQYKYHTTTKL